MNIVSLSGIRVLGIYACLVCLHPPLHAQHNAPKVLHLSFHAGCTADFEDVAHALNLDLTSWFILSPERKVKELDGKTGNEAVYNITHERAHTIWERHKEYFNTFDAIVTSDIAPLSRIFLQNGWKKPLIIWICNRFDYFHDGPPDKEYYELFAAATRMPNVHIVAYTPYEHVYARAKGIDTGNLVIKPLGSEEKKARYPDKVGIPQSVQKQNYLFLYRVWHKDSLLYIAHHCVEAGVKIYTGLYNGPNDLTDFKGVIYFPYQWSGLAFFENIQRGIVHFIPSEKFVQQLAQEHAPVGYPTLTDFALTEWYCPEHKPYIVYFDSWQDLNKKAAQDYTEKRIAIKKFAQEHRATMLNRWRKVFDTCEKIINKRVNHEI